MAKKGLNQYKGELAPDQVAEGMRAASGNAVRLVEDAALLLERGRYPSSAALAILAIEEAGKHAILRELAVAQGDDKALEKSWRAYRSHTKKNVGWLLPQLVAEGARSLDDFLPLFSKTADHPFLLDNVKQLSLYTDCLGDAHWSLPSAVVDEDLAKMLIGIARLFLKQHDATPKEIELWIKHMQPHLGSGAVADFDGAKQAMLDLHADMQQHGLTVHGDEEVEAFIRGSSN